MKTDFPSLPDLTRHLLSVTRSEAMQRSKRGAQLLRYLAQAAQQNAPRSEFKETVIGMEVFGRPANYDPRSDPIVRVSVGDLRKKLNKYYETEGRLDPIRITIPIGSYAPNIHYEKPSPQWMLSDKAAMCVANARTAYDQRTLPAFQAALDYLDTALKAHPGHPRLLALKALVHIIRAGYGGLPSVEIECAQELVDQAKAANYEVWELFVADGHLRFALHFDWAGAEILFNRALELSHGESRYNTLYAAFLASQLRFSEFLEITREAVSHFAHHSVMARCDLAAAQIFAGHYDDAEHTVRETLTLFAADRYMPCLYLAMLHEAREEFSKAVEAIEQITVPIEHSTLTAGVRGLFIGLSGDQRKAREIYDELLAYKSQNQLFIPASQLGCAALGVNDFDAATGWFREAACIERDPVMNWLGILPFFRHIRHYTPFRALVEETMHLRFPASAASFAAV